MNGNDPFDSGDSNSDVNPPRKEADRKQPPPVIPGYQGLSEIRRGGQAVVYRATQNSTGQVVAIKILLHGPLASSSERARFQRELKLLAEVERPGIVSIIDSGVLEDGEAYHVTRFIAGANLDAFLADDRPANQEDDFRQRLNELLRLFLCICEAVDEAHRRGIVHRDLKPSNIRIDLEGRPHVLDFGLARRTAGNAETAVTVTGDFIGTLRWSSPEQAAGKSDLISTRTDVYSLGLILYEMLTGETPYEVNGSTRHVLRNIISAAPVPPSSRLKRRHASCAADTRRRHVPPDSRVDRRIESIVLMALEKNPDRRYTTAGELAADVRRYLEGSPIQARPRRRSLPLAYRYGIAALVLVGIVVYLGRVFIRPGDPQPAAVPAASPSIPSRLFPDLSTTDPLLTLIRHARDSQFEQPVKVGPGVNSPATDGGPALSSDQLTLVFHSDRSGGSGDMDLWMSRRNSIGEPFGDPVNLGTSINSPHLDAGPCLSSDGLTLLFHSNRPGGRGGLDLWMCRRNAISEGFGSPTNLGESINTDWDDSDAALSGDGLTLYFQSNRPGSFGGNDLWMSRRESQSDSFPYASNLGIMINSVGEEGGAAVSGDGLILVFHSDRAAGYGGLDLWMSVRSSADERFAAPFNLGHLINHRSDDRDPALSPGGLSLYFVTPDDSTANGSTDLWLSKRRSAWVPLGTPVNLGQILNQSGRDAGPSLSRDGLLLAYQSERQGDRNGDIRIAWRTNLHMSFGSPVNLGEPVNSVHGEGGPFLADNGRFLLFDSSRPGLGGHDIWFARRSTTADRFETVENPGAPVNSAGDEWQPFLSDDGLTLLFSSDRPGGEGEHDIWMCTRKNSDSPFSDAKNLGPGVNSPSIDSGPWLSDDGLVLIFASTRAGAGGPGPSLWFAARPSADASFTRSFNLGPVVNSAARDAAPYLHLTGNMLYFDSVRPGGRGGLDLWMAPIRPHPVKSP
ncbi:MAG: protein kinase [Phycisphaeraceae bacterium]